MGRLLALFVSLELLLVSNCPNNMGDAYGGLRLHIVIISNCVKDMEHHTANVSDAYGGLRLRIANVIPIYAIDATDPFSY